MMPGACQFLGWSSTDQELHDEYEEIFAGNAEWTGMVTKDPLTARTHHAAVTEGRVVADGRRGQGERLLWG